MPTVAVPQVFAVALQHHQAGRLVEAEALYRQVLAVQPNHGGALHLLGVVAQQVGRPEVAVEWIRQAIAVEPGNANAHSNLGEMLRTLGRLDEAVACQRRALELQPDFAQAHYNLGVILAERGQRLEAVEAYRRAIQYRPDYLEAFNNLGNVLKVEGRLEEAVTAYRDALQFRPDQWEILNNLGVVLLDQRRLDEAVAAFERVIQIRPDFALGHCNLGNALRERGDLDGAVAAYGRALRLQPECAEAHYQMGLALAALGRNEEAVAAYRRAIAIQPEAAEAYNNLGNALRESGLVEDGIAAYRRALELRPDYAEAHNNLGNALRESGQSEQAMAAYQRALAIAPDLATAHYNLGNVFREWGRGEEAEVAYRRALVLDPGNVRAWVNLGNHFWNQGRLEEAVHAFYRALEIQPEYADAYNNLGNAFKDQGRLADAEGAYRRALQLQPGDVKARNNLIYLLHFRPGQDESARVVEEDAWNRQVGGPAEVDVSPAARAWERNPERRLRVGYVSPDFRDHVVGRNVLPLFREHDRASFDIVCYAGVVRSDAVTEEIRRHADRWRNTIGVSDEALVEMIRQDEVNILVDLTQHMAGNRLPVFARRPAPVQVSFAGYPASAGMEAIGYRISDRYLESEIAVGRSEIGWKREAELRPSNFDLRPAEQVFLIDSFWCYDPCGMEVGVNESPAQGSGGVTFGSLNNFCKVNDGVLKLWARVLGRVPGSRLVLLSPVGGHRQRVWEILQGEGIEVGRVEFVVPCPRREYLELYQRLDVVLDPFPYGGHTTSLDALWMGVPVVSLAGERAVSRAGLSQMSNLGLREMVAFSEDEYVAIAAGLAGDLGRLAELRRSLRSRMEASALMDGKRFTRNIEEAYRGMWRQWCGKEQGV